MAKKKKHNRKKSSYKAQLKKSSRPIEGQDIESSHAADPVVEATEVASGVEGATVTKASRGASGEIDKGVARRARREVRHSVMLAGLIMIGLVLLWCLFAYTSVGAQVYRWVRI